MSKKSFLETLRLPPPCKGVQVNFCKNPSCTNFAIHPLFSNRYDNDGVPLPAGSRTDPLYKKSGASNGESSLHCKSCDSYSAIKSNEGVKEEIDRISAYLKPKQLSCPNEDCCNYKITTDASLYLYKKSGKAKSDSSTDAETAYGESN